MNYKTYFPLYSPGRECEINRNNTLLTADVRSEESTVAVFECRQGEIVEKQSLTLSTQEYTSPSELLAKAIESLKSEHVKRISLAVPGPVIAGYCETPNLPWSVDAGKIKEEMGFDKVYLINDLEATAYSLAETKDAQMQLLNGSSKAHSGNVAILAPGNGLGEAGLFFDGAYLRPFATEGGHTEFAPRNDFEVQFYQFLNKIYGIVTWEKVLTKEGLYNIYRFLRDIGRHPEEEWLQQQIAAEGFLPALMHAAQEKKSRLVKLTINMFLELLAREANNLVLKLKATGGLIITGEITDVLYPLIDKNKFYKSFLISDRMEHLLEDIPIYVLSNEKSILEGAAYYGIFFEHQDS